MVAAAAFVTPPRAPLGLSSTPVETAGAIASGCSRSECVELDCPVAIAGGITVECKLVEFEERGCLIAIPGSTVSDCRPVALVETSRPDVRITTSDGGLVEFVESRSPVVVDGDVVVGWKPVEFGQRGACAVVKAGCIASDGKLQD